MQQGLICSFFVWQHVHLPMLIWFCCFCCRWWWRWWWLWRWWWWLFVFVLFCFLFLLFWEGDLSLSLSLSLSLRPSPLSLSLSISLSPPPPPPHPFPPPSPSLLLGHKATKTTPKVSGCRYAGRWLVWRTSEAARAQTKIAAAITEHKQTSAPGRTTVLWAQVA